jgi:RNA polymerase sigma-70 factor (ECF subfamily)
MQKSDTANENVSDSQLGKPEFWRAFLAEQIPHLYQMFQRHGIHTALAEELVQATVLNAIRGTNTYDPTRGSLEQWLFGIASNSLALEMRQRQYRPKYNGDLLEYLQEMDSEPLPEEILEHQENVERIRQAMATLDPSQQDVLTARYHEDLPVRQIGRKMNLTEKAVESLLYRARNNLRVKLQEIKPLTRES